MTERRHGRIFSRPWLSGLAAISLITALGWLDWVTGLHKKIRDKDGRWQPMEAYFGKHANTQFSHGYCPDCARRAMEELGLPPPNGQPGETR